MTSYKEAMSIMYSPIKNLRTFVSGIVNLLSIGKERVYMELGENNEPPMLFLMEILNEKYVYIKLIHWGYKVSIQKGSSKGKRVKSMYRVPLNANMP